MTEESVKAKRVAAAAKARAAKAAKAEERKAEVAKSEMVTDVAENSEIVVKKRPARIPMHKRNRLNFPKRDGYHRHVFNDVDDKIQQAQQAGYVIVMQEDMPGGDTRAGADSQMGTPVKRSVGGGVKGVLMEIPKELYDEDQKAKQGKLEKQEKEKLENPKIPGMYGGVKISIER